MLKHIDVLPVYLSRIFAPHGDLFAGFVVAVLIAAILHSVFDCLALGAVIVGSLGYGAYLANEKTFRVVPTFCPQPEQRELLTAVAAVGGMIVAFLSIVTCVAHDWWILGMVLCATHMLIPSVFALLAYDEFKEHVYPVLLRYENDQAEYDLAIGQKVENIVVLRRLAAARDEAVDDSRRKVLTFWADHRRELGDEIDERWILATCHAEIPDDAPPERAYAAAAALITRLQGRLTQVAQDSRKRDEKIEAIDEEIDRLREAVGKVSTNPLYADDPVTQKAEVSALQRRIDELIRRKSQSRA